MRITLPGSRDWNEKSIKARWKRRDAHAPEGLILEINGETVLVDPAQFRVFANAALMCVPPQDQDTN